MSIKKISVVALALCTVPVLLAGCGQHKRTASATSHVVKLEDQNPKDENKVAKKNWKSIKRIAPGYARRDKYMTNKVRYDNRRHIVFFTAKKSVIKRINNASHSNDLQASNASNLETLAMYQLEDDANDIRHEANVQQVAVTAGNYPRLRAVSDW